MSTHITWFKSSLCICSGHDLIQCKGSNIHAPTASLYDDRWFDIATRNDSVHFTNWVLRWGTSLKGIKMPIQQTIFYVHISTYFPFVFCTLSIFLPSLSSCQQPNHTFAFKDACCTGAARTVAPCPLTKGCGGKSCPFEKRRCFGTPSVLYVQQILPKFPFPAIQEHQY